MSRIKKITPIEVVTDKLIMYLYGLTRFNYQKQTDCPNYRTLETSNITLDDTF